MYFDPNELEISSDQPALDPAAARRRVQRDVAGLVLLLTGAVATVAAVAAWSPAAAVAVAGIYLMVAGGFIASGRSN
ncbi:hypothetical protein GCM10027187_39980 [Streptosporangium sandarakinum]|uniref:Uncharacterized protein n=1 Tax=Streptosporangium sandarakinum TaxID=1260955 RepID=A0A852V996_9ACTN|nr:hypothetical protein [Streptosporangium sandarakinum]NYF44670.1 hypothetical protein [Streptosporangium sandarakinum]